jgi:uncharacterized RDD family membrane protein YckC
MSNEQQSGIECPRCAYANDEGTRFCNNCGLQIDGLCPSCGTRNAAGPHFCGNCGHDFVAAPADIRSQELAPTQAAERPPEQAPPTVACPRCHSLNEPRAVYCYNCGLPLGGEKGFARPHESGLPAFAMGAPAGFWVRLLALVIDVVILTGAAAVFLPVLFGESIGDETQSDGAFLFGNIVNTAYFTLLVGMWGATLGKRMLGMRIVRSDGRRVGIGRALGRELATILSLILLLAGYLMVAFRSDKRALHDLIADTVVIRVRD